MAWRDWALPLLVGVVGGLLLAVLIPGQRGAEAPGTDDPATLEPDDPGWVFAHGPRVAELPSNITILYVVPPGGDDRVPQCLLPEGCPQDPTAQHPLMTAAGDGLYAGRATDYRIVCVRHPCDQPGAPYITRDADAAAARFGRDGHNATRMTVYVFQPTGELLAANAPDAELARFRLSSDFTRLPEGTWYLGENATTPPGTTRVPAAFAPFVASARPLLAGLPEGGIATVRADHWLLGELWLTARLDAVVHAP